MRQPLRFHGHRVDDLAAAAVAAVLVEIGLRTTTLPRLARFVGAPLLLVHSTLEESSSGGISARAVAMVQTARAVMRRWPFGDSCLRVALVSGRLLRSHEPSLVIGVRRFEGQVAAHAWLVVDGRSLDPASASFRPIGRTEGA